MSAVAELPKPVRKVPLMERLKAECPPGAVVCPPSKFRLVMGIHTDDDIYTGRERTWAYDDPNNNVIETFKKLEQLNGENCPPKFEKLVTRDGAVDLFAPMPGETKELYKARVDAMIAARVATFDSNDGVATATSLPTSGPRKPLEQMSEKELRDYAAEDEIDVTKLKGRDAVLKAVLSGKA